MSKPLGPTAIPPSYLAAETSVLEVTELLLKALADPDAVNYAGWTPLHFAILEQELETARGLWWQQEPRSTPRRLRGWMSFTWQLQYLRRRDLSIFCWKPELTSAPKVTKVGSAAL